MIDPDRRRAALIATAVTVPFVLIAVFVLASLSGGTGGGSPSSGKPSGPLPPVTAAAPPHATAQLANCTKVLQVLPVSLKSLPPRAVHTRPDTPFVVAWGNPAVVFSCGVARPKSLHPGSDTEFRVVDGVPFDLQLGKTSAVYTTVDRGPYIAIDFPAGVQPANYLSPLASAIAKALPAVCTTNSATPDPSKLCTRRP